MTARAVYTPLPEGLDDTAPGPVLAALLWSVVPESCNSFQIIDVVRAQYRQVCAELARLLLMIAAMARSVPGGPLAPPGHRRGFDCHADTELGCALRVSGPAAADLLLMAATLTATAPGLLGAMLAGELDLAKLRMLSLAFTGVDPTLGRVRWSV